VNSFFYEKLKRHSVEVTFVNQLGTRNSGIRIRQTAGPIYRYLWDLYFDK